MNWIGRGVFLLTILALVLSAGCATTHKPPRGVKAYNRDMEVTAYDAGKNPATGSATGCCSRL